MYKRDLESITLNMIDAEVAWTVFGHSISMTPTGFHYADDGGSEGATTYGPSNLPAYSSDMDAANLVLEQMERKGIKQLFLRHLAGKVKQRWGNSWNGGAFDALDAMLYGEVSVPALICQAALDAMRDNQEMARMLDFFDDKTEVAE